ncbi:MAG: hypothetical protein J1F29_02295 [Lentimicrobiaceae bacterium]|nr:hypothetical protein [Lentimicrobiaceae bacterium]
MNLAFAASFDGSCTYEFGRYPSLYGQGIPNGETSTHYFRRNPYGIFLLQGRFSIGLTYEIKNVLISVGCSTYVGEKEKGRDRLNWKTGIQPKTSWILLGLGYHF